MSLIAVPKFLTPNFLRSTALTALCGLWCALTFSQAFSSIFLVLLGTSWLLWRCRAPQREPYPSTARGIFLFLAAYGLWILVSAVASSFPKESLQGLRKTLTHFLIFFSALDLLRPRGHRRIFLIVISLWSAWTVVNSWIQLQFGADLLRHIPPQLAFAGPRLSASFKSYGLFAAYLILQIPILTAVGLALRQKRRWKPWYFYLALFFPNLWVLFMTLSRGAILAFLLGTILFLVWKRKWLWILILIAGCAFTAWKILPKSFTLHLNHNFEEQSIVERAVLWDRALQVIRAEPWTGTGINTYAKAHAAYDKTQSWRVKNYYAHNGYLQIAAETGLPGLLFFLGFLGAYFSVTLRRLKHLEPDLQMLLGGILLGLFNFLIFSLTDTILQSPPTVMLFWLVLGFGLTIQDPVEAGQK